MMRLEVQTREALDARVDAALLARRAAADLPIIGLRPGLLAGTWPGFEPGQDMVDVNLAHDQNIEILHAGRNGHSARRAAWTR